jgi:hypothetical protein
MPSGKNMTFSGRQKKEDAATKAKPHEVKRRCAWNAGVSIKRSWGRARLLIVLRVLFREPREILRHFRLSENRVGLADRDAGATVNAIYGVDVELRGLRKLGFIFPRMNAINRANLNAFLILGATFNDYICHDSILL